jgi:Zn-dependent protease
MQSLTTVQFLAVAAVPMLFAITAHEAAHGWVANLLGDKTALMLGRVTFNPFKHLDPIGTVLVPIVTLVLAGFVFGWAKPVPVNWRNLHQPRRDMALVALAGPAANLVMALFWGLVVKIGVLLGPSADSIALPLALMGAVGLLINLFLMVLNLVPLLPLDGGRVLSSLLPPAWSAKFSRLEPYGLIVLVLLIVLGFLGTVIVPVVEVMMHLIPGGGSAIDVLSHPMRG